MFIESILNNNGCKIIVKMEDISVIREEPREYPDFKTTYRIFVNGNSWCFAEKEGLIIYEAWKAYLMERINGKV